MKGKRIKTEKEGVMSELPDEIIITILSKLEIKEAAKTSVLSSRWRYMWTFFSGNLDFDGCLFVKELRSKMDCACFDCFSVERDKFTRYVDQVLKLLQKNGNTLEGLRICFNDDGCASSSGDVDAWIKIAIQKKIKKLELDLNHFGDGKNRVNVVPSLRDFTSLHVLRLKDVPVTEDVLDSLLSRCPFLHVLGVCSSNALTNFKVSSLKLKVLEISHCYRLKTLQLSAENLESFSFHALSNKITSIAYEKVPNVVNINFSGDGCIFFKGDFYGFYPFLSQIKVLKMRSIADSKGSFDLPDNFPKLLNLKHLELTFVSLRGSMDDFLTSCISLPRSCPSLTLLVLKLMKCDRLSFEVSSKFCEGYPFLCLEELKVLGFSGDSGEIEFVKHIIESAMNLEKITIDPLEVLCLGKPDELMIRQTCDKIPMRRARAFDLESHTPSWIDLIIL